MLKNDHYETSSRIFAFIKILIALSKSKLFTLLLSTIVHNGQKWLGWNRETATGKFMLGQGNGHYIPIFLWFRQKSKN